MSLVYILFSCFIPHSLYAACLNCFRLLFFNSRQGHGFSIGHQQSPLNQECPLHSHSWHPCYPGECFRKGAWELRSITVSLSSSHPPLHLLLFHQCMHTHTHTHMHTPPQNNERILWSPVVQKSSLPHSFFFFNSSICISRITAAQIRCCCSLARVCQAQRGL